MFLCELFVCSTLFFFYMGHVNSNEIDDDDNIRSAVIYDYPPSRGV